MLSRIFFGDFRLTDAGARKVATGEGSRGDAGTIKNQPRDGEIMRIERDGEGND
jgi:hypothetical protein